MDNEAMASIRQIYERVLAGFRAVPVASPPVRVRPAEAIHGESRERTKEAFARGSSRA